MLPENLTAAHFARYPSQARDLACKYLAELRQMPLVLIPNLLRQLIDYDHSFPAEQSELNDQLIYLRSLDLSERILLLQDFRKLQLVPFLGQTDWVNEPLGFTEMLSAYLWSSGQMEAFRAAATAYGKRLSKVKPVQKLPMQRLGIAVIGRDAHPNGQMLFRHLRPHGTYFSAITPGQGFVQLLEVVKERAHLQSVLYAHWYVDGGSLLDQPKNITCISYDSLKPVRDRLLDIVQRQVSQPGVGPEELRNSLAHLSLRETGMGGDPVLDHFQLRLLTEGSGTQIFSTTFTQWAVREALIRAQPLTLLARFAPRQRQRPMNELLAVNQSSEPDPQGSLVDADMAAYYHWINQQRLPGADTSAFLVWLEGTGQALAISPALPRGTVSTSALQLGSLLRIMTS